MFEGLIRRTEKARGTLRRRLLMVLAIAFLPFLIIASLQTGLDTKANRAERRDALLLSADRAIARVEQFRINVDQLLRIFAEDITAGQCAEVHNRLAGRVPGLLNVMSVDPDGVVTCNAAGGEGMRLLDAELVEQARRTGGLMHTQIVPGQFTGHDVFVLALPNETADGVLAGWSTFSLSTQAYLDVLRRAERLAGTRVALVDNEGEILGSDGSRTIPMDWIAAARDERVSKLYLAKSEDGRMFEMVLGRIGPNGVYALISKPSKGILGDALLTPMRTFGLPFLAMCVTLMAAWLATDQLILVWLQRLRQLAVIYREGLYGFRNTAVFDSAPVEVQSLARTLNEMADRISERDESLKAAIEVRDDAVKEIHHRVKNNLQIVTSFLNLQRRALQDEQGRAALSAARHRIDALAIVHSSLYQHERLELVSVKPFLEGLLSHLSDALGLQDQNIGLSVAVDAFELEADAVMPIALFIVEAVTHAMLEATDCQGGEIAVTLQMHNDVLELHVAERGLGAPELIEPGAKMSLGARLMTSFARQLQGRLVTTRDETGGYRIGIVFPGSLVQKIVA